jgi:hypothetical protein
MARCRKITGTRGWGSRTEPMRRCQGEVGHEGECLTDYELEALELEAIGGLFKDMEPRYRRATLAYLNAWYAE